MLSIQHPDFLPISNRSYTEGAPPLGCKGGSWASPRSFLLHVHHQHRAPAGIKTPTAPCPILRMLHQSTHHRIRVHVIQLLFPLPLAIHIEIVKSRLPERPRRPILSCESKRHLPRTRPPLAFPRLPRLPLLHHLQHRRKPSPCAVRSSARVHARASPRIRATGTRTAFSPSQFANEGAPRPPRPQQRPSAIATERHKVQFASTVISLQPPRHRHPTPRPTLAPRGWGILRIPSLPRDVSR